MATNDRLLPGYVQLLARTRNGGPRPSRFERQENIRTSMLSSSAMPLDIEVHWTWRNPLNIIPATMLLFFVIGIVGTIISLV